MSDKFNNDGDVRVYLPPAMIIYQILPRMVDEIYSKETIHAFNPDICEGCAEKRRTIRGLYYALLDAGVRFEQGSESEKIIRGILKGKLYQYKVPGDEWKD